MWKMFWCPLLPKFLQWKNFLMAVRCLFKNYIDDCDNCSASQGLGNFQPAPSKHVFFILANQSHNNSSQTCNNHGLFSWKAGVMCASVHISLVTEHTCDISLIFVELPDLSCKILSKIYTFFINLPEMKGNSPWCLFETYHKSERAV